jgi:hypothetical protein
MSNNAHMPRSTIDRRTRNLLVHLPYGQMTDREATQVMKTLSRIVKARQAVLRSLDFDPND